MCFGPEFLHIYLMCVLAGMRALMNRTKIPAAFISAPVVLWSVSAADSHYLPQPCFCVAQI